MEESTHCVDFLTDLYESQTNYDVIFVPEGRNAKQITAHKAVIEIRFPQLLLNSTKKGNKIKVRLQYEYNLLSSIIEYCYTSYIDLEDLELHQIVLLHSHAQNFSLLHLRYICEHYLINILPKRDIANLHRILFASSTQRNVRIYELAIVAAVKKEKYNEFISYKGGIYITGIETFSHIVANFQHCSYNATIEEFSNTLNEDFKQMKI